MFEAVMKVLQVHLLNDTSKSSLSVWEQEFSSHIAFCDTRVSVFLGEENNMETLSKAIGEGMYESTWRAPYTIPY